MSIREKLKAITPEQAEKQREDDINGLNKALIRAGIIIVAGQIIGAIIGWIIARG